jgi:hypothetical protein
VTVRELIQELEKVPQDRPVVVEDHLYGGHQPLDTVYQIELERVNSYLGPVVVIN